MLKRKIYTRILLLQYSSNYKKILKERDIHGLIHVANGDNIHYWDQNFQKALNAVIWGSYLVGRLYWGTDMC